MLKIDKNGKAVGPNLPTDWMPHDSAGVTKDLVAREVSRIAFDDANSPKERLSALKLLGEHVGFTQHNINVTTVDATKREAMIAMFDSMTMDEKIAWMNQQAQEHPLEAEIAVQAEVIPEASQSTLQLPEPSPAPKMQLPDLFQQVRRPVKVKQDAPGTGND